MDGCDNGTVWAIRGGAPIQNEAGWLLLTEGVAIMMEKSHLDLVSLVPPILSMR